ncbi:MAG: M56 family metallopeptidase, partial [Candidatus Eremiobacteraeota bacterium]|nr:M56 family metallopeptidase [Candidatus Eremiobacteraeota bacterium]
MSGLPQIFITFVSALSATALNALWEDALLVVCIALLLRFWPRINAATRYTVWSATLVAAFVLPLATTLAFFAAPQPASVQSSAVTVPHRLVGRAPVVNVPNVTRTSAEAPATAPPRERLRFTLPVPVAIAVFVAWLLLAFYALARLTIGLTRLEQLKKDALPLPVEYRESMPQWTRANKGARDVRLCISDDTDVPVAVGLFDSMILVPHSLLDGLSQAEVDQICLHELAHLRRGDDWSNGLQRVLIALLGWNPAALFIGQQLDLEREVACDDWVLSLGGMVRPYALCLTKMAERAAWPRHPIPAPGVFATRKHISLRIERLLGAGRN